MVEGHLNDIPIKRQFRNNRGLGLISGTHTTSKNLRLSPPLQPEESSHSSMMRFTTSNVKVLEQKRMMILKQNLRNRQLSSLSQTT
mmetsp:Transcript_44941/g.43518  ORF Transcript_44941/g.43518 Transcript_44941/m.43518 type:complete len:86 (-) Transcript_44941:308-565(-)